MQDNGRGVRLGARAVAGARGGSTHLRAIMVRNSGKSMVPLPSASTSLTMSWSSASVGFWPRERITVPSSLVVMVPSPSLSKREKASLNSAICSSVSWSAIVQKVWWVGRLLLCCVGCCGDCRQRLVALERERNNPAGGNPASKLPRRNFIGAQAINPTTHWFGEVSIGIPYHFEVARLVDTGMW